jgi:hypothetical protein
MDGGDLLGELMFGRKLRLRVLLWAWHQDGEFHQTEAARGVEYSSTGEVGKELERLVGLGMLRKFGRPSGVGAQFYVRVAEHPGWDLAGAAARTVAHLALGTRAGPEPAAAAPPLARLNGAGRRRSGAARARGDGAP